MKGRNTKTNLNLKTMPRQNNTSPLTRTATGGSK